jgi:predicted ATPase/DNA-binding SARP family transcriptional activator
MELRWQISLLGRLRAEREGAALAHFRRQKTGILLAYLAYFPHRTHPRDALIELLWPDTDLSAGRASLSVALSFLRQHLEPPGWPPGSVLLADRSSVRLNPEAIATDVAAFEAALRDAARAPDAQEQLRCLTEAAEWYRGELLPGCYDEWALLERERLAEAYLQGLTQLVGLLEAQGDLPRALDSARRAVSVDPLREESHRELIRVLGEAGQVQAARRQFAELERLLKEELETAPTAETRALVAALGSQTAAGRRQPVDEGVVSPAATASSADAPTGYRLPATGSLPSGTVTFLMIEIDGGAALWEPGTHPSAAREGCGNAGPLVQESLHLLLRGLLRRHGGCEVKVTRDGFLLAFQSAGDALACAVALQRALTATGSAATPSWLPAAEPLSTPVRVRVALHTGEAQPEQGEYRTPALHLTERLLAAGHPGQILCSEVTATLLRRDLEPGSRLLDLGLFLLPSVSHPERLFQVVYPGLEPASFPPLRAEARHSGHLPPSFSRFFGRDKERALLQKLLTAEEARLVTLMGPGGSGKSRLGLEVARELVEAWQGAIWFVPLADVTEPKRLPDALRHALALSPSEQEPLEQVAAFLAGQPSLLLLDNLEHLLPDGAALVRTLLTRAPSLTCLVTSRRRLNLSGERIFSLRPLPVPADEEMRRWGGEEVKPHAGDDHPLTPSPPHLLLEVPSVQLFVDRVQATRPDFQVTEGNAAAVGALCRRLEGLPLAIELAAARAGVLSPPQILAQLERGLGVLTSRQADVAERHRSLRGAVEWSVRLLDPTLQRFFVGLAVFQGGFSLEAAEAVSGEELALDYLEQLRECSLVLAEEEGTGRGNGEEMRYRLLETLREYGREQWGEEQRRDLERRHAVHFRTWTEHVREQLRHTQRREHRAWLERLESEHDNLRAALAWAVEREDVEIGLRLAAALGPFWEVRGYFSEGREHLTKLLALTDSDRREELSDRGLSAYAWALRYAGTLAWRQSDYGPARVFLDESIAMHRARGDRLGAVAALHILGAVAFNQADLKTSRAIGAEALAVAREIESVTHIAIALHNLAHVALAQCDYGTSRPLYAESLSLARTHGDRYQEAYALHGLGEVDQCLGDWASARAFYEESLALRRELADPGGVAMVLADLGFLARDQGEYEPARLLLEESLSLRRELGDRRGIALTLYGLGTVASCEGDGAVAQSFLEESLTVSRKQGDRDVAAIALLELGVLMLRRGDPAAAGVFLEESLALFRESGTQQGIGAALCSLGTMAADQGNEDAADAYYRESLAAYRSVHSPYGAAQALEGVARVAGARQRLEQAAQLYGAAAALREALGAPVPPADRAGHEQRVAAVRAGLGEAAFAAAWEEGRARRDEVSIGA